MGMLYYTSVIYISLSDGYADIRMIPVGRGSKFHVVARRAAGP